jgi:hypothetical protein
VFSLAGRRKAEAMSALLFVATRRAACDGRVAAPPQQMRPRPDGRTPAHGRSLGERRCNEWKLSRPTRPFSRCSAWPCCSLLEDWARNSLSGSHGYPRRYGAADAGPSTASGRRAVCPLVRQTASTTEAVLTLPDRFLGPVRDSHECEGSARQHLDLRLACHRLRARSVRRRSCQDVRRHSHQREEPIRRRSPSG